MTVAVNVNSLPSQKINFLDRAQQAYADALPDWIEELAKFATATSASAAARKIGVSVSAVTQIIGGTYPSKDWSRIEDRVRGELMRETVICPVIDEITKSHCLDEQAKNFTGTSAVRTSLYHACRSGCPHSRLKTDGGVDG
jgi:DNA-binding transcriptional regulator YdaS (Cro superfamily)